MTTLVTGGTGTLGVPAVAALRARGVDTRVLSRRAGDGRAVGDLATGTGLDAALAGVGTVLHLATTRRDDAGITRVLLDACRRAEVGHLVYVSIVGVDRIPLGYYRRKLACEHAIAASGVPYTILRATQFHEFVADFLDPQARWPVTIALDVPDQPVDVGEVAARLVELAAGEPAGRVDDLGGPELLPLRELAARWQAARGVRRPIWTLPLPGAVGRAFRAGYGATPLPGSGIRTFADWAAARAAARR